MDSLFFLRFIMMSFIFLHHLNIGGGAFGTPPTTFFFVISGFTIGYFYNKKFKKFNLLEFKEFCIKRYKRLFPMHILSLVLVLILNYVMNIPNYEAKQTIFNILLVQSWLPNGSNVFSYNGVAWFCSTLLFLYIISPIILLILNNIKLKYKTSLLLIASIAIYFIGNILIVYMTDKTNLTSDPYTLGWWLVYISPLFRIFDYMIGLLFGYIIFNFNDQKKLLKNSFVLSLFFTIIEISSIVFFVYCVKRIIPFIPNTNLMRMDMYYIPCSIILITIFALNKGLLSKLFSKKPCVYLGKISFYFFMLHQVIIRYFASFYNTNIFGFELNKLKIASQIMLYVIILIIANELYRLSNFVEKRIMQWKTTQ